MYTCIHMFAPMQLVCNRLVFHQQTINSFLLISKFVIEALRMYTIRNCSTIPETILCYSEIIKAKKRNIDPIHKRF